MPFETDNTNIGRTASELSFTGFSAADIWAGVQAERQHKHGQGAGHGGGHAGGQGAGGDAGGGTSNTDGRSQGAGADVPGPQNSGINGSIRQFSLIPGLDLEKDGIPVSMIKDKTENWTVAIDLAASLPGNAHNPIGAGVDHQLQELKALAKETEGKSVNFVVHAERPVDGSWQPCYKEGGDPQAMAACTTNGVQNKMVSTERYFIHDGKIDHLQDLQIGVEGGEGDIASLLHDASKLAPSKNLGLIIQSHGDGSNGLGTNAGPVSLVKLTEAIDAGLANTSHQKLDLIDYDSCDMANSFVLDFSRFNTTDVVASSATEYATRSSDGQNLSANLRALMANDNMTGREFGDAIVRLAQDGKNGVGHGAGTPTLTNFDLTNFDEYKEALDKFGAALTKVSKNPANSKELQADIDRTEVPYPGYDGVYANNRDLRAFTNYVLEDAQSGKLQGNVQPLIEASKHLLAAYDQMATSTYGDKEHHYENLGGMTVFLPGKEALNYNEIVESRSPMHKLNGLFEAKPEDIKDTLDKETFVKQVQTAINAMRPTLQDFFPAEMNELIAANVAMAKSQNLDEYKTAYAHMQTLVKDMDASDVGALSRDSVRIQAANAQTAFRSSPFESLTPGWDAFVESRMNPVVAAAPKKAAHKPAHH